MSGATTLLALRGAGGAMFDGSVAGLPVTGNAKVKVLARDAGLSLAGGQIDIGRHPDLDALESFTIEALITPSAIGADRQNIVEAQTPSLALFMEGTGRLVGSIHLASGWTTVTSGARLLKAGVAQRVTFSRDPAGRMALQIDGRQVGTATAAGPIQNVGTLGLRVGMGMDGRTFPFTGTVAELDVRQGVVTQATFEGWRTAAAKVEKTIRDAGFLKKVSVHLIPDESHARLQRVKDIVNAAGIKTLSDLGTLPIRQLTRLTPGQTLVAPRKNGLADLNWGALATAFRAGNVAGKRELLASRLTNRNSISVLQPLAAPAAEGGGELTAALRKRAASRRVLESMTFRSGKLAAVDPGLLSAFAAEKPWQWPTTRSDNRFEVLNLATVPLDTAVVIAGTLDLTDQQLVCEPGVKTLYIIAETVICGNNAAITWRRPGGSTPARADDPGLNGRGFSGVHTKPGSRDGMDGGDGAAAGAGIAGASGRNAPNIEMWVKNMTGLPNLDFNGEDGIAGGMGQSGGRGGRGGRGRAGEALITIFGSTCWSDPGDGGDGGNGGRGGDGGRGGSGGNGGSISIGVLTGTLAGTVANKSARIKNQGGRATPGGQGGRGGVGGLGGRSGNGDVCTSAENGRGGAQGQPGNQGPSGAGNGSDATVTFFEFTQAAWDDLMARPWITAVSPPEAFAGDSLTINGSRFTGADRVVIGSIALPLTINADESASITLPPTIAGGDHGLFVRRADGVESNRVNLGIKPQLDASVTLLAPATEVTLSGRSFLAGASVLLNGEAISATVTGPTRLNFTTPGIDGAGSAGGTVSLQVHNPDGRVSNSRQAMQPRVLEVPFRFQQHNLSFGNFNDGVPDWGTYEDTFGAAEVMHELLDPIFGHPVLTAAYFGFYKHFLKGTDNGGLATGYCTSLASLVADRFWQGRTDTHTIQKADVHKMLTGVHGKLLSRQTLLAFHDQGRQGISRVERTYREIEATFLRGTDRQNAPLLFFIPSGEIWDSGYLDKLSDSHCVMPYRFVYPPGAPPSQLTPDLASTLSDPDQVELFVWDCNHPKSANCRLRFRRTGGTIGFDYFADSTTPKFTSEDGITLGMMRHGNYMLADHDLPFGGPFGLTSFIVDFLLSPADLEIVDANGLRAGNFGGQLRAEIPGSHPAYLMKGLYLLPPASAVTRTIVGTGNGAYDFHSVTPDGASILLEGVATRPGHRDVLSISADATQIRFTPAADKQFSLTMARIVDGQARAVAVTGVGGGPAAAVDVTVSPELSLVRVGNRAADRTVEVRALAVAPAGTPVGKSAAGISLPKAHDLAVTVTNWSGLDLQAQAVPF